jgi:pimeloyl-ACP methyl ester carboxylesterase
MTKDLRRWLIGFAVALAALAGGIALMSGPKAEPAAAPVVGESRVIGEGLAVRTADAFYDPPVPLPKRPGTLLRSEPLKDVLLPKGMRAWRILYTTTVDDKTPATAVAIVFAPVDPPAGPLPVIMWEHGSTGATQRCMPSLTVAPALGIPALDRISAAKWVIVATDYSFAEKDGPHPFLIGEGEARAGLDSVRAARQMPELTLDRQTVVWGHSQGGHAALWTGIVGPRYAPDVPLAGVAAIAPAADIGHILALNPDVDKRLGPYLAYAYSRFYPDIRLETALRPQAAAAARQMALLCVLLPLKDAKQFAELGGTFEGRALAIDTSPALVARIVQNTPNHAIAAPVLIAQGLSDSTVPPAATDAYVAERCAAGQRLEYWTFQRAGHVTIVEPGIRLDEPLVAWTAARFANEPQPGGCERRTF